MKRDTTLNRERNGRNTGSFVAVDAKTDSDGNDVERADGRSW
jgi:hypothetical protein